MPVLLGYSLGKAQEILCSLSGAGLTPMLHGSVYRMTQIYEQFGQAFCHYERYDAQKVAGKVLICPPSANRSRMLERIRRKRVAMISGWAVDPNAIYRYQVDAAFPLSDHADYTDLLRYVELVQPKRVLTLHGFAAEFARDLRDRGVEAWALSEENQLELTLRATPDPGSARDSRAVSGGSPESSTERTIATERALPSLNFAIFSFSRKLAKRSRRSRRSWRKCGCSQNICARSRRSSFRSRPLILPARHFRKAICARSGGLGGDLSRARCGYKTGRCGTSPHREGSR